MKTLLILAVLSLATTAMAETSQPASKADHQFMDEAAQGGMAEVKMGELAQRKSSRAAIKAFGETLVRDHSKANDQLKELAASKSVTLPAKCSDEQEKHYSMLEKLDGAAFDKAFAEHMVSDHKQDISKFQTEAQSGKDSEVKRFASETLPTLQEHLKTAQALQQSQG